MFWIRGWRHMGTSREAVSRLAGLSGAATADLRDMPRDVQEIAFAKGIPYIPADRKDRS